MFKKKNEDRKNKGVFPTFGCPFRLSVTLRRNLRSAGPGYPALFPTFGFPAAGFKQHLLSFTQKPSYPNLLEKA